MKTKKSAQKSADARMRDAKMQQRMFCISSHDGIRRSVWSENALIERGNEQTDSIDT